MSKTNPCHHALHMNAVGDPRLSVFFTSCVAVKFRDTRRNFLPLAFLLPLRRIDARLGGLRSFVNSDPYQNHKNIEGENLQARTVRILALHNISSLRTGEHLRVAASRTLLWLVRPSKCVWTYSCTSPINGSIPGFSPSDFGSHKAKHSNHLNLHGLEG